MTRLVCTECGCDEFTTKVSAIETVMISRDDDGYISISMIESEDINTLEKYTCVACSEEFSDDELDELITYENYEELQHERKS